MNNAGFIGYHPKKELFLYGISRNKSIYMEIILKKSGI
jgi:hypothetical protein